MKYAIYSKVPVRNKDKLKAAATEHMETLEKSSERVKKYFQDVRVKYAAWKFQLAGSITLSKKAWRMVASREGINSECSSRFVVVRVCPAHQDYLRLEMHREV